MVTEIPVGGVSDRTIHLSLHFHHLNDLCINMSIDFRSNFNVSLIVRGKVSIHHNL